MITRLDDLNTKVEFLKQEVSKGKFISTDLASDSKPSCIKSIFLNIITLGIYSVVFNYKHNSERVVEKINLEVKKVIQNYKFELEGVDLDSIRSEYGPNSKEMDAAIVRIATLETDIELENDKLKETVKNISDLVFAILKNSSNEKIESEKYKLIWIEHQFQTKINQGIPVKKATPLKQRPEF